MREKPSRGYLEWALSRFGAEWVEANLQVNSSESEFTTTSSAPEATGLPSGTVSPREKKMTVVKAKKPLRLLTDYRPQQMPSIN